MENRDLKGFQGIFFDEETEKKLIELQKKGLETNIKNMHITFKYGIVERYPDEVLGKEYEVELVGYASDGKNSGFSVIFKDELDKYYKGSIVPHITVSIGEVDGVKGKPVDTSKLEFKSIGSPVKISGKLGYFIYDKGLCFDNEFIDKFNAQKKLEL